MKNSELQDLFVEYYPALKSFAVRYVGAAEVAEDLVQDVFLRLWEKTNPLQGVRDVSAYLYQMVRFRAIDYLRSEKTKERRWRSCRLLCIRCCPCRWKGCVPRRLPRG
ncbi:MAG: hypothetical protein BHV82_15735 [Odoribacter sp. 43_10]|nr:MAG: hypothetical protein BHV82_15735 [Odoribacter sp. 43_10]